MKITFASVAAKEWNVGYALLHVSLAFGAPYPFSTMGRRNNFSTSWAICLQLMFAWDKMAVLRYPKLQSWNSIQQQKASFLVSSGPLYQKRFHDLLDLKLLLL